MAAINPYQLVHHYYRVRRSFRLGKADEAKIGASCLINSYDAARQLFDVVVANTHGQLQEQRIHISSIAHFLDIATSVAPDEEVPDAQLPAWLQ